jgi:NAD-dependent deacetylase
MRGPRGLRNSLASGGVRDRFGAGLEAREDRVSRIVILTGAGISAESGLSTFRDAGGIWSRVRLEDVATPEGFARNPAMVQDFYNSRRANVANVAPNAAHHALARLQAALPGEVLIVTQNVDDLHDRASGGAGLADGVIHMHGELLRALCADCGESWAFTGAIAAEDVCRVCGAAALRPDVVWFGETPYRMEEIAAALEACELFVSIGTSGAVYPAAGFVAGARASGARTLELNLEPSEGSHLFDQARYGRATEIVPAWVDEVLAER